MLFGEVFAHSPFVDVLVESSVARYLDFQGLKRIYHFDGELLAVPLSKAEIFQDAKRKL